MYDAQAAPVPGAPATRTSQIWIWICCALAGVAAGAGVASGVWWYVMRVREAQLIAQLTHVDPNEVLRTVGGIAGVFGGASSPAEVGPGEKTPTKKEIADYMNGKTLSLPEGDQLVLNVNQGE